MESKSNISKKEEHYQNETARTVVYCSPHGRVRLESFAEINSSRLEGSIHLGKLTAINNSTIGRFFCIGSFSFVSKASIGHYTSVGSRVCIGPLNHPMDRPVSNELSYTDFSEFFGETLREDQRIPFESKYRENRVIVGSDVWIGDNSVILSGANIANGTVIGAGAIVTKQTEAYGIYVGNPARLIRKRFSEDKIEELEQIRWWDHSLTEFPEPPLFESVDQFIEAFRKKFPN